MARVNLGKVVPEKGVDYYTEAEKIELKQEIENDLSTQINKNKTDIQTLQTESGNSIEMLLDQLTYKLTLKLKNKAGQQISSQEIDLPNENSITDISYNNGKLTLTKQSGTTTEVDISGLINGLATETALNNLANVLKETIGIQTNTYDNTKTYNTGDIVVQNEKIYKANQDNITGTFDSSKWDEISLYEYQKIQDEAIQENYKVITKLQEDVEDLTERVEDAENNEMTNTPEIATSHYLQDSADSRFRKFIPIGRTTQESTTGKNLAGLIDGTYSNNNVTVIVNNGKVTINGTPSFNTFFNIATNLNLISGDYVLYAFNSSTIGNSSASGDYADIRLTNTTGGTYGNYVLLGTKNNKIAISLSNDDSSAKIVLRLGANLQFNNFVITPMLIKGTSTAEPYEPYTGGEPAPNPNYPYAIKNTGDNVNLCKLTQPGLVMNTNNTIVSSEYSKTIVDTRNINSLVVSGDFSLLGDNVLRAGGCNEYPDIGVTGTRFTNISANQNVIDTTNYNYIIFTFVVTGGRTEEKDLAIENSFKIEQGTHATPYSPYGCGNVNEKVQNKNFVKLNEEIKTAGGINLSQYNVNYTIDNEGCLTLNGTSDGTNTFILANLDLKPNTYNLSIKYVSGTISSGSSINVRDTDGNDLRQIIASNDNVDGSFTNTSDGKTLTMYISSGKVFNNYKIKIQLEQGSTATDYVPHSEQNISFPLAEGQKFYEGSHPDDDEKVHHKMGEIILDGTENWEQTSTATSEKYRWLLNVGNVKATSSTSEIPEIFSTHYKAVAFGGGNGTYNNVQGISVANYGSKIGIYDNTYNTDLTAWKAYLAEQYANGTPVKVIYPLAEEQTEDFTEEQQTAWEEIKKARTYKNVTHISSEDETPANVELEYVRDINTIDDRITALEAKVDLLEE